MRYRDVSLIAVGKFVYISDERFRILHEPNSEDWFLTINSVSYKDEGIYECQVNSDPYKTFKYHLSVVGEYFHFYLSLHQANSLVLKVINTIFSTVGAMKAGKFWLLRIKNRNNES